MTDADVELIEVIRTRLLRRGGGGAYGDPEPVRIITQYWSKDGDLLAEIDPLHVEAEAIALRARAVGLNDAIREYDAVRDHGNASAADVGRTLDALIVSARAAASLAVWR